MPAQTATVLVTDLVGSTALRTRLGEEEAERLRRLHDGILRTAVETHGGSVVKGLGDGVLATFPETGGAVAAAVAIQQAADAHTRRHGDLPLILRVGLSAGDVTVEDDGDCFGTPVIEASRLCAAADGGQILAAELVRLLARGRGGHSFTAVGELDLKGLAEPVATVEIGWERASGTAGVPFPPLLGPSGTLGFAGRASELELLATAWKEAAAGGCRAVFVGGEPGVGKTRLLGEAARRVHKSGGAVLYGRCEEELGVPYEPFLEALAFLCHGTPAAELPARLGRFPGELTRLLPELADLVPGLDAPLRSDPETEQYRLFEAVTSWLAATAQSTGLLLVVDDLHWAPAATLRLLGHVLRAAGSARLLVAGTFRDTEVGSSHPLGALLSDLRRIPGAERLPLPGLSVDELSEVLEALPRGRAGRALAATLHDGTKGNPFFVGEILRHLSDAAVAVDALPVPEGVRDVILSRVARLSEGAGELLGAAAVIGRDFDLGPLVGIASVDEDSAVAALDAALAARLVEETGVARYRFVHALVRSALHDTLSATRRARLHLRAAGVFESAGTGNPARVAHHLVASAPFGERSRTARACLAAGDRALLVLADAEAGDWYAQGLSFTTGPGGAGVSPGSREDDPELRIDLLTGLGESQRRVGDAASRQTLLAAARLAAEVQDAARLVRAVLANYRGFASITGDVDSERLELIEAALNLVGPGGRAARADLLALLAAELAYGDDHLRLLRAADEAASIARDLDDVTVRARVGVTPFLACLVPDRVTAMVSEGASIADLADRSGDPQLRTLSRALWVAALLAAGSLAEARGRAEESMTIADETGRPGLRSIAHFYFAGALDALGDHQESARLSQAALDLAQDAWPDAVMWYGGQMALHWLFEGQPDVAGAVASTAFSQFPGLVSWQGAWGLALALGDRDEELAGFLAELPSVLPRLPVDMLWLVGHFTFALAQGFGATAPTEAAAHAYEILLPYRSLHAAYAIGYFGPMELALAVLARVGGNAECALAHHRAAAEAIDACGAARARALNDYQWARTLISRNASGDRGRAIEIAQATMDYCQAKGYATFVDKTDELLRIIASTL